MTYDYHGHWDKKTGHVSPMYAHPEDDYDYFNTVSDISIYVGSTKATENVWGKMYFFLVRKLLFSHFFFRKQYCSEKKDQHGLREVS